MDRWRDREIDTTAENPRFDHFHTRMAVDLASLQQQARVSIPNTNFISIP